MKRFLAVLSVSVLVANLAIAGDDSTPKSRSGDRAWLFSLNGLSNLGAGSFMGGVGAKYYISDGNAVRLSLGFATTSTTTKYTGVPNANFADIKQSGTGFSISPAFLHNINSNGPVLAYLGLQVTYATNSTTTENPNFVANNKIHDSNSGFGVAGIAGVEWFAWNYISLGAEYQIGYTSTSGTHEVTTGGQTVSTDNPSTSTFAMGSASSANFTVAIFW